jgi:AAA15 family ATPase/GTPase
VPEHESVMLLDEIENGININYSENLLKIMCDIYKEKQHQLIVTTHSTVFLDYVEAKNIVYLYRDQITGLTKSVKLFDLPNIKERLQYMYPGEVLLNMSNEDIAAELLSQRG